ncbi:MAG: carboxypeptidase-like regulatory domain-containing protein [Bacteroidota bacterium]
MKKFVILSCCLLLLMGCRKNSKQEIITEQIYEPPIVRVPSFKPVTASVFGTVIDEEGNPVVDAQVTLGDLIEQTNGEGQFVFSNKLMNQAGTFIKVEKEGYHLGGTRFFPAIISKNYVHIRLLKQIESGRFQAEQGGLSLEPNGLQINFPANAIVDANNSLYNDEVIVFSRWIDPQGDQLETIMPGNLQGINSENKEVALATYGMVAVELKSPTGEALNLGNGQMAEITFPLSNDLSDIAPPEIPLWSFHEEAGIWMEEGIANLQGNDYVGAVSHFSFWNCDDSFPLVELSGTLVSQEGLPVPNILIRIEFIDEMGQLRLGQGVSDNEGRFSGKVPANQTLRLRMFSGNDQLCFPFSTQVSTSTTAIDLEEIVISEPDVLINATGKIVDCFGVHPDRLNIIFTTDIRTYYYYFENQSQVEFSFLRCEEIDQIEIKAIDLVQLTESSTITVPVVNNQADWGPLLTCSPLTEFIRLNLDGVETVLSDYFLSHFNDQSRFITRRPPFIDGTMVILEFNELNSPGNYDGSVIKKIDIYEAASPYGLSSMKCNGSCDIDQVSIDALGAVGEKITGSIEGTFVPRDSLQQDFPFTMEFQVNRDE